MNEIARIDTLKDEQEAYLSNQYQLLKRKVQGPARFVNMLVSNVPGIGMVKDVFSAVSKTSKKSNADWLTKSLMLITPLVLNRTFLRNAGWLKKGIITLASETAVSQVNQSRVSNVVNGIANFIRPKKDKKTKKTTQLSGKITAEEAVEGNKYGIPEDSETY